MKKPMITFTSAAMDQLLDDYSTWQRHAFEELWQINACLCRLNQQLTQLSDLRQNPVWLRMQQRLIQAQDAGNQEIQLFGRVCERLQQSDYNVLQQLKQIHHCVRYTYTKTRVEGRALLEESWDLALTVAGLPLARIAIYESLT